MGKLTVAKIKKLDRRGLYGDGGTLYLAVSKWGSKSWVQRVVIDGRRRDIGLGGWPVVSLAEAREAAFENRKLIRKGGDPLAAKRRDKLPTFREAARMTFEANATPAPHREGGTAVGGSSGTTRLPGSRRHAYRPDRAGGRAATCSPRSGPTKAETARKVRQRNPGGRSRGHRLIGHIEHNVAGDAISGALPTMPAVKQKSTLDALRRGCVGSRHDRCLALVSTGQARLPVYRAHRCPLRRGPGRDVGRDRHGGAPLAHPRSTHEGRCGASRPIVRCCVGSARTGEATCRRVRAALPLAHQARQDRCRT